MGGWSVKTKLILISTLVEVVVVVEVELGKIEISELCPRYAWDKPVRYLEAALDIWDMSIKCLGFDISVSHS